MKSSAAMTFVLAILVCLAALFAAGDACDKVPTMTWIDACHKACDNQPWYDLCPETLRNAPVTAEVTVYALVAARLAKLKYDDTMAAIVQTLADGSSLPAGEWAAVDYCRVKYSEARALMASVTDKLPGCDLTRGKQEYLHAKDAVESCKSRISSFQGSSPLFTMVSANLDATMVAYDLGALLVGMNVEGGMHASLVQL